MPTVLEEGNSVYDCTVSDQLANSNLLRFRSQAYGTQQTHNKICTVLEVQEAKGTLQESEAASQTVHKRQGCWGCLEKRQEKVYLCGCTMHILLANDNCFISNQTISPKLQVPGVVL